MSSPFPRTQVRAEVHQGDAVEWLRSLPGESVDLLITDPAYESLEKHRKRGTTTRLKVSKASSNEWFTVFPNARFEELFVEVYRILRPNTHFYLQCDQETMFAAVPIAEKVGFRFWKPLIWDKCLGPDTPVWTTRGTIRIADVREGDRVAIPEGGTAIVRATRRTYADSLKLLLSDGSHLIASCDHRFVLSDGRQVEASELCAGDRLCTRPVREHIEHLLRIDQFIPDEETVLELPDTNSCLWCGKKFDSSRAASAHQARFCDRARSKKEMAEALGITPKRLRRWMQERSIPASWARRLGLDDKLTARSRLTLQNNLKIWFPEQIPLDYNLGKVVGLFAAEGSWKHCGVTFAFHTHEKHLQNHISRFARSLGVHSSILHNGNRCVVDVSFRIAKYLFEHFVGGQSASEKFLKPAVYRTPPEFRQGVLWGILEGDGHWSQVEQRETLNISSLDLAMFVHRELVEQGSDPTIRRFENDHAGGWRVRYDPGKLFDSLRVESIEAIGVQDLVDISIDHPQELFILGNGVVTHNCCIGMGYHYRARYELILFFEKGKRKLNDLSIPDIITAKRIRRKGAYPTEKPVEVYDVLIKQSSLSGELVVDPFCGSGACGESALGLGRNFAGCDLSPEAVRRTLQRTSF